MQATTEQRERWNLVDDAQFAAELHAVDPQRSREEFDAIIAAEWPAPTRNPPNLRCAVTDGDAEAPGARTPPATATGTLPWRPHGPDTAARARERSPPLDRHRPRTN